MDSVYIENLLYSLCERLPYGSLKIIFDKFGIPVGNGSKGTFKKVLDWIAQNQANRNHFLKLSDLYLEHLLVENKIIRFYDLTEEGAASRIYLTAQSMAIDAQNSWAKCYPVFDDGWKDNIFNFEELRLVGKREDGNGGMFLVFASKKVIKEKVQIDMGSIAHDDRYSQYESIYGIKRIENIFFDVVYIDTKNKKVEFRLDMRDGLVSADRKRGFDLLEGAFVKRFSGDFGWRTKKARNFLKYVEPIYESGNNHFHILELGSIDDEGAIRNEHKPYNQDDVRKGSFHAGGLANLKAKNLGFKIFKLEAEYSKEKTFFKERAIRIEIPGQSESLIIGGVNEIILSKCQTISDYNSIISIIESL